MGIFQSSKKEEESDKKLNTESNNIERPTNIKEEDKPKIIVHIEKGNIQPKSIKIEPENGIDLESTEKIQKREEKKHQLAKYPQNLYGRFEFEFYGDIIEPDCIFWDCKRKYYIYFDIYELKNILEEKLMKIEKDFPLNYEDLKQPLEEYMNTMKKTEYVEKLGFWDEVGLIAKFIFSKESFNEELRTRAKKYAYLISQIKGHLAEKEQKNDELKIIIAKVDSLTLKIDPCYDPILDEFNKEVKEINIKKDTEQELNDSLKLIKEKYDNLTQYIKDGEDENIKKILYSFLAYLMNSKLSSIEDSSPQEGSDSFKMMSSLRSQVNRDIIQNIDGEKSRNYFFNKEFILKVIKDIKKEKNILLTGININTFYTELEKDFKVSRDHLLNFKKDENEKITEEDKNKFFKIYMTKVENLENLDNRIEKELNAKNKKMVQDGFGVIENGAKGIINIKTMNADGTFNAGKNIIDSSFQVIDTNIEKKLLKKTRYMISYQKDETIRLIKEFDLLEKMRDIIEDENFEINSINGILISKEIDNLSNPLTDKYSVDKIY